MKKHRWTEAEREFVRENAGRMHDAQIAAALTRMMGRNVTPRSVRHTREMLSIKKKHGRGRCEIVRPGPEKTED